MAWAMRWCVLALPVLVCGAAPPQKTEQQAKPAQAGCCWDAKADELSRELSELCQRLLRARREYDELCQKTRGAVEALREVEGRREAREKDDLAGNETVAERCLPVLSSGEFPPLR